MRCRMPDAGSRGVEVTRDLGLAPCLVEMGLVVKLRGGAGAV